MHSSSVHFIDNLIDNLYRSSQLNKDEFRMKSKSSVKSSFDSYTMPFALADEDKQHRSGLRTIMTVPMDAGSSLQPIYLDQFMTALQMEAPKKVIQYMASSVPIVDPASKTKQVRAKATGGRGPQRQFKTAAIKRALPEVASIYNECNDDESDSEQPASKKSRLSMSKSSGEDAEASSRRSLQPSNTDIEYEAPARKSAIPKNFYTIITPLFEEFWNMEFENDEVTWAFFAVITNLNCREFKLEAFAEQSYSLAIIKDKLKHQTYVSPDDFAYDFSQLFGNVLEYYPETHEAYRKALELSSLFHTLWRNAQAKFK